MHMDFSNWSQATNGRMLRPKTIRMELTLNAKGSFTACVCTVLRGRNYTSPIAVWEIHKRVNTTLNIYSK